MISGLLTAANAALDAMVAFMSIHFVAPETIYDERIWKGMGVFILFNVAKTMAHYFKTPPKEA